jgi:hypothetical protein
MRDTTDMKEYIRSLRTVCNRCGADNPDILVFHHTNPETKSCDIGPHLTKERIDREFLKCEIVCFNCHMLIHRRLKPIRKVLVTRQKKAHELTDIGSNIARGRFLKESLSRLPISLLKDIRKEINLILPKPSKTTVEKKPKEQVMPKPLVPPHKPMGFEVIPFGYIHPK